MLRSGMSHADVLDLPMPVFWRWVEGHRKGSLCDRYEDGRTLRF